MSLEGTIGQVFGAMAILSINQGDSLDLNLPPECADAWIQDPPAGISFMGKAWDGDKGGEAQWIDWAARLFKVAFDALKPGAHGAVWALPRTADWTMQALRRAGFEVRDVMVHLFASGFPKSLDISKYIDSRGGSDISWFGPWLRAERQRRGMRQSELAALFPSKTGGLTSCVSNWELGFGLPTAEQFNTLCNALGLQFGRIEEAEREIVGQHRSEAPGLGGERWARKSRDVTAPATPEARRWAGWGTALKPSSEHWILVRRPLRGTVAANVIAHGTGGINVDAGRVGGDTTRGERYGGKAPGGGGTVTSGSTFSEPWATPAGRWPANTVLSHASWDESACATCGLTMPFAASFCPACGAGVEVRRGGCRCVGERRVRSNGQSTAGELRGDGLFTLRDGRHHGDSDGLETVDAWECLATCDRCGASALVPSGGDAGPCAGCGALRRWACPVARLDEQSGVRASGSRSAGVRSGFGYHGADGDGGPALEGNAGGASRFFHCFPPDPAEPFWFSAKPSTAEREAGTEGLPKKSAGELVDREDGSAGTQSPSAGAGRTSGGRANHHPTVKGFHLIGHLCDLLVPPGGLVLDLTAGSGTLGAVVAHRHHVTGWRAILGEMDPGYCEIIRARCKHWGARPWRPRRAPAKPVPKAMQVDLFANLTPARPPVTSPQEITTDEP